VRPAAEGPAAGSAGHGGSGGPRLHVLSQGQGAWDDRRQIASFLGLVPADVLVTQVATGGAFGGKEDLNVQAHTALLALATGRPVLLALSRAESLRFSVKRPFAMDYTVACDAEGHLVAVRARMVGDNGAYASVGGKVLERAAGHACGAYRVPNVDVEARAVHTNNPPSGAMRGFGANQANFALEALVDRLAEAVGIDGWRCAGATPSPRATAWHGQKLGPGVGLKKTLLAVRDQYRAARYAGIACGAKNTGIGNGLAEYGRAVLRPDGDGRLTLFHSWTEMGQGTHTVFRQIAASELGLDPERITVTVDTSHELDTGITTASRATMLGGQAVLKACADLHAEMARRDCSLDDLAGQEFRADIVIDWTTPLGADVEEPVTHFGYGWATLVVILDDEGRIEKVIALMTCSLTPHAGRPGGGVHMGSLHASGGLDMTPDQHRSAGPGHHPGTDAAGRNTSSRSSV
jgi:xanthine dehydrogenase molybdenum-binding subunit